VVGVRYGKTKNESCNFDCQSRGPYCGDGIVQPEFGEECDGDQSCSTWDNQPGKHVCLPNCKQKVAVPSDVTDNIAKLKALIQQIKNAKTDVKK